MINGACPNIIGIMHNINGRIMQQKRIYRIINLVCLSMALAGCSWLDPHKTIWETAADATKQVGVGNRSNEYQKSKDQHNLAMPEGVALSQNAPLYPIPTSSSRPTLLSDSNLPPSSFAARAYLAKHEPNVLQAEQLLRVNPRLDHDNGESLVFDNDFQLTWDITGLAIVSTAYTLVKSDHTLGIYFISDPNQKAVVSVEPNSEQVKTKPVKKANTTPSSKSAQSPDKQDKKDVPPLYQIVVQGDNTQSRILLVNSKGQALSPELTDHILQALKKQFLALNSSQQPITKPATLLNTDVYGNTNMLLNRAVSQSESIIRQGLKKAGFVIIKFDPNSTAYFFMDARKTDGKVNAKQTIYLLYYRDKGIYSSYYVLDSNAKVLNDATAKDILSTLSHAIN